MAEHITAYQYGTPRKDRGLRIGTTRLPPRGVYARDYARLDFMDVWLPELGPSRELLQKFNRRSAGVKTTSDRAKLQKAFYKSYEVELRQSAPRHMIGLLAELAKRTSLSIGCFCPLDGPCHNRVLLKLLRR